MTEVARTELDSTAMQQYAQFLKQAPQISFDEMSAAIEEALQYIEREVKEATPTGAHQLLRQAWTHAMRGRAIGDGLGVAGEVFNPLNYALPVELGTRPHFPPIQPLRDWVEKKLGVDPSESRSVAFMIARKIARRGTKGAHMAENTLSQRAQQILAIVERAIPRIAARLEAGE